MMQTVHEFMKMEITGKLDFETVPLLWKRIQAGFREQQAVCLDFSRVTSCNSAALSLLIECIGEAKKTAQPLEVTGLPARLLQMAEIAGMDFLVDWQGSKENSY